MKQQNSTQKASEKRLNESLYKAVENYLRVHKSIWKSDGTTWEYRKPYKEQMGHKNV